MIAVSGLSIYLFSMIANQRAQLVPALGTILNLNAIIGTFNGKSNDAGQAQGWLSSLETTALLNQWTDLYKLEAAHSGPK